MTSNSRRGNGGGRKTVIGSSSVWGVCTKSGESSQCVVVGERGKTM